MAKITQQDIDAEIDRFAKFQAQIIQRRIASENASELFNSMTQFMQNLYCSVNGKPKKIETLGDLCEVLCGAYAGTTNSFKQIIQPAIVEYLKLVLAIHFGEEEHNYHAAVEIIESAVNKPAITGREISDLFRHFRLTEKMLVTYADEGCLFEKQARAAQDNLQQSIEDFANKNGLANHVTYMMGQWYAPPSTGRVMTRKEHIELSLAEDALQCELDEIGKTPLVLDDEGDVVLDRKEFTARQLQAMNAIYERHLNKSEPYLNQFERAAHAMHHCYQKKEQIPRIIGNADKQFDTSNSPSSTANSLEISMFTFDQTNKNFAHKIKNTIKIVDPKSHSKFYKGLTGILRSLGERFKNLQEKISRNENRPQAR